MERVELISGKHHISTLDRIEGKHICTLVECGLQCLKIYNNSYDIDFVQKRTHSIFIHDHIWTQTLHFFLCGRFHLSLPTECPYFRVQIWRKIIERNHNKNGETLSFHHFLKHRKWDTDLTETNVSAFWFTPESDLTRRGLIQTLSCTISPTTCQSIKYYKSQ